MTFPSEQFAINLNVSCNKDDAIAKLLGLLKGAIHHEIIEIDNNCITLEQLEYMDTLYYSLDKHLTLLRQKAMVEASKLVDTGVEKALIDAQLEKVLDIEDLIVKAKNYILDFDEELEKHALSMLQIDYTATNKAGQVHFKLKSLNTWAHKKYGISIDGFENKTIPEQKIYKLREQERLILLEIKKLGLNPKLLPVRLAGKRGTKANIRFALNEHPLFQGTKIFDKAWQELRNSKDIKEVEQVVSP